MRACSLILCGTFLLIAGAAELFAQVEPEPTAYAAGQVIVRFDKPTTLSDARATLSPSLFSPARSLVPSLNIFLVKLRDGKLSVPAALELLKANPQVRWAQADHLLSERATPNDPLFVTQWNMNQSNDADIDAPEAWDITTGGTDYHGNQIVVAVVDGGCLLTHQDLAANIWVNANEIAGNEIDDDSNGYVDDVNGWDAYASDGSIPVTNHGTHVSGIVGARSNNGVLISGVNWNVKIMLVAASSTQTSIVSIGYNYIIDQKNLWWSSAGVRGANIVATNSSFGVNYGNCESGSYPIWNDLYNEMGTIGILSSCATANFTVDVDVYGDVPTGCSSPYMISVTNTTSSDQKNSNAAYGDSTIDLGAPGTNIRSLTSNNGTGTLSGTSMSTPHVSGAIALLHSAADSVFYQFYLARPDMACFALKQILLESVDPLPGFDTLTVSGGRLNLRNALLAMADFEPPDTVLRGVHIVSPNGGEEWYSGNWVEVQWSSFGLSENVKIELNRDYPNGLWEVIFPDIQNYGIEAFLIEGETTTHVRLRVSSLLTPALSDVSDGDIHLVSPILDIVHNSLGDFEPGAGTVTCWASDSSPLLSVAGVYMFFRATGGTDFDSLDLLATGNPSEYSADLSSFAAGNYEYYVQMRDNADRPVRDPVGAPVNFHTFTVGDLCEAAIAYDDGTAEFYGWSDGGTLNDFEWAVKFTPVGVPYVLCGASVAVSHGLPDTMHSPIQVRVYDANGAGGQPGTLLWQGSHGSIGNEIGGLSAGIHWADVVIRDGGGEKLMLSVPEFYISVSNLGFGKYEAFGRDANGPNAHRSYFYDPCEVEWFSEDDTTASDNAYPGNRMIRALGYAVAPPDLVAARDGDEIKLHWSSTGAPLYNVYSSALPEGPFGFLESTTDTILTVAAVDTTGEKLFYRVQSATE